LKIKHKIYGIATDQFDLLRVVLWELFCDCKVGEGPGDADIGLMCELIGDNDDVAGIDLRRRVEGVDVEFLPRGAYEEV
jgi:hypothetical protein